MSKNKLTVVKQSPPPALPPQRSYADFDNWAAIADDLVKWSNEIDAAADRLLSEDRRKPVTVYTIAFAERVAETYSDDQIETMAAKWQEGEDWYNRPELYDERPNGGWGGVKRQIVSEQVALLFGSFPNAGPHNGEVYTRMLIEEIYSNEHGGGACPLESACRLIRRTMKFPPSIAEFLKVLEEEKHRWSERWDMGDGGPVEIAKWFKGQRNGLLETIAEAKSKLGNG